MPPASAGHGAAERAPIRAMRVWRACLPSRRRRRQWRRCALAMSMSYAELDEASSRLAAYLDARLRPSLARLSVYAWNAARTGGAARHYQSGQAYLLPTQIIRVSGRASCSTMRGQRAASESSVLVGACGLVETVLLDGKARRYGQRGTAGGSSTGSSLAHVMYTSVDRTPGVLIPQRAVTRLVRNTTRVDIGSARVLATCRTLPLMRRRSSSGRVVNRDGRAGVAR